jgi:hypothetical protein
MSSLEHNIKEAFAANGAKAKLANKDGMWNRLDNQMGRRKGVAAFWRVAAIVLGFMIFTGAFAALHTSTKQKNRLEQMELENTRLSVTLDSLLLLPLAIQPEVQIIEKEKIVYRDRVVVTSKADSEDIWRERYKNLADSTENVLASQEKFYSKEIKRLENELEETRMELGTIKQISIPASGEKQAAPFELKSEQINVDVTKEPAVKNPELKMKVFQKNFIENRNNLNKNIFKK